VRILASIENPYIVSYKDAFIDDNNLCIVMEYAEGGDIEVVLSFTKAKIRELQRKRTHMNEREVWKLISHSLQGLQALHELKIMHRDMKSANIFMPPLMCGETNLTIAKATYGRLVITRYILGCVIY
jgi:NIMA (never in mitosis gene a)-related kinase